MRHLIRNPRWWWQPRWGPRAPLSRGSARPRTPELAWKTIWYQHQKWQQCRYQHLIVVPVRKFWKWGRWFVLFLCFVTTSTCNIFLFEFSWGTSLMNMKFPPTQLASYICHTLNMEFSPNWELKRKTWLTTEFVYYMNNKRECSSISTNFQDLAQIFL